MKTYPAYKRIKGTFYEQLPCDWNQLYLKQVCSEKCIKNIDNIEKNVLSLSYGRIIKKRNKNNGLSPKDFATYQIIKPNDIILRLTDLQNDHKSLRTGISEQTGIITSAYTCLTEIKNSRFLHYVLHAMDLNKVFYRLGSGVRQSLSYGDIRYLPIPAPSLQEQQQIVRYLDWKTSQINHLIHGYERLISLLEERKTAVINEAVTKGIHKGVAMKKCPIQEIDIMPSHWKIVKAQRIFKEFNNLAETDNETVLSLSQKDGLIPFDELKERTLHTSSYENWKQVFPGDLVLNRFKAHLGVFFASKYRGMVTFHYGVYTPLVDVNSTFFEYLFHTEAYKTIYAGLSNGMTVGLQNLSNSAFYSSYVILPPVEEQNEIVDFLDAETRKVSNTIQSVRQQIEFLRERRTRLISDVVTGAFDVREIEVPEYTPEQDVEVTEDGDEYEGERA